MGFPRAESRLNVDSDVISQLHDPEILLLLAMYQQIGAARSQIQTGSGFFCSSGGERIPNAIPWKSLQGSRIGIFHTQSAG